MREFVDLCILCGCDYTHTIGGLGPKTAYALMKEQGDIETVMAVIKDKNVVSRAIKKNRYIIPENYDYETARKQFIEPEVITDRETLVK